MWFLVLVGVLSLYGLAGRGDLLLQIAVGRVHDPFQAFKIYSYGKLQTSFNSCPAG